MDYYYTILKKTESDFVINRSHFITTATHIENMEEAKDFIEQISKQYNDATHNCYAYIADNLGLVQRFSDDGEPSGTAGLPMLEVLKKQNLKNIVVVVTRYFGGIKLGAGGLVSAYTKGVTDCLKASEIVKMVKSKIYEVKINYSNLSSIEKAVLKFNATTLNTDFGNDVKIKLSINSERAEAFLEFIKNTTSGKAEIKYLEERFAIEN